MENGRREKIRLRVCDSAEEREHFHQDIELLYVLEGAIDVDFGEQKTYMKNDDILVINANKRHMLIVKPGTLYAQLMIEYNMVSDVIGGMNVIYWCDSTKDENEKYNELRKILKCLLNHQLSTGGNTANFGHIALSYRVIDYLSMYFLVQTSDKELTEDGEKFEERLQQINNYIRANYNQPISLKDLADKLYLSNGYLSRFFKKNYGMNFVEYLTNVRLFHAVDDLLYTNTPITRIAYDNGFASIAVFNKAFKKAYGETPSAFRKDRKEAKDTRDVPVQTEEIERRLEQYLKLYEPSEEEETEKICEGRHHVSEVWELKNYWGNTINIGAASDLLRSEIQEHVVMLKSALGFRYVRFSNIFSKEMLLDLDQEKGEYNFSKLDSIIDFLLQLGMKPHIELGMKPRMIMYNVQKIEMEGTRDVEFPELSKWERAVTAVMRHLTRRYGNSETDTWKVELWFNENKWDEPDAEETYFELFRILYQAVRKFSGHMMVGGCGIRMDYKADTRELFYKKWMEQECRPDYVSIMYYPYDRGEERNDLYSKRSSDNELMIHRVQKEKELLKRAGMGRIPVYMTEWNLTASSRNYINDSCFKGAYVIKNMLDICGEVEDTGYFMGSDRGSEFYDSGELLYGGNGIISKDGILKPAGFAFDFLNRLYSYCIGRGKNYLISTDRHGSFGIICHNQRPLGYQYYYTREDEMEKERLWKYYEDRENLEMKLQIEGIQAGYYQVKTYRINEQNGNMLGIWKEMGFERELSRNDIKYFRRMCEPKLTISKLEAEKEVLDITIRLQPNEIAFIRVRQII